MSRLYRQGAIGALLDEYEKAIAELIVVISDIPDDNLILVIDPDTQDQNCRSFQAILSHVVYAGFGYASSIYNLKYSIIRPSRVECATIDDYASQLHEMFTFTEKVLCNFRDDELEQFNEALKIKTGWGQVYDIEQMMEHAIVHILRHRRQIEKLKKVF